MTSVKPMIHEREAVTLVSAFSVLNRPSSDDTVHSPLRHLLDFYETMQAYQDTGTVYLTKKTRKRAFEQQISFRTSFARNEKFVFEAIPANTMMPRINLDFDYRKWHIRIEDDETETVHTNENTVNLLIRMLPYSGGALSVMPALLLRRHFDEFWDKFKLNEGSTENSSAMKNFSEKGQIGVILALNDRMVISYQEDHWRINKVELISDTEDGSFRALIEIFDSNS